LDVPHRRWIARRPEPRLQVLHAQMTSNARHGLPPRLMANQSTRFTAAQESKPSPSPGIRIMLVVRVWNDHLRVFEHVYVSLGEQTLPACVSCDRQFGAVLNREND